MALKKGAQTPPTTAWTMVHRSTPSCLNMVSDHSLQMGLITNLLGAKVACLGLGNTYTRPLGYIIIQVQVDRVQGYDEDQIALVVPDLSNFVARIPVILGTPTINHVINVLKEKEINALAMHGANARVALLLLVHRMIAIKVGDEFMEEASSNDYDKVVFTQNVETIEAFSCHAVQVRAERAHTSGCINVMTQALWAGDGSLPQGHFIRGSWQKYQVLVSWTTILS